MLDSLLQMKNSPRASVWLFSTEGAAYWNCHVSGEHDGLKFEIKCTGDNLAEAIASAFEKWSRVTGQMPEFAGALPPVDDEIPF